MTEPRIIHTEIIGPNEHVHVQVSSPVPYGSHEETALLEWAEDNLLPWESADPSPDTGDTEWIFVIVSDPANYYTD